MDIKNHNKDRKRPVMRKRFSVAVFIAVFACIVLLIFQYFGFVSKTIYPSVCTLARFSFNGVPQSTAAAN